MIKIQKKVESMSEIKSEREKIILYLTVNDIPISALATTYGETCQNMSDYLSGRRNDSKARQVILKIISDLKIR